MPKLTNLFILAALLFSMSAPAADFKISQEPQSVFINEEAVSLKDEISVQESFRPIHSILGIEVGAVNFDRQAIQGDGGSFETYEGESRAVIGFRYNEDVYLWETSKASINFGLNYTYLESTEANLHYLPADIQARWSYQGANPRWTPYISAGFSHLYYEQVGIDQLKASESVLGGVAEFGASMDLRAFKISDEFSPIFVDIFTRQYAFNKKSGWDAAAFFIRTSVGL
jgi:hypothetical protein